MRPVFYTSGSAEFRQAFERSVALGAPSSFPMDSLETGAAKRPNLVSRVIAAWRKGSERRRAFDALMSFDDRLLSDLGIVRGEVESAVSGRSTRRT